MTLRLGGGLQVATRGTISELAEQLPSLSEFVELAGSKLTRVGSDLTSSTAEIGEVPTSSEAPVIKVTQSTTENIRALFNTPWGKTPRNLEDVSKALEVNAAPDTAPNTARNLARLVQLGELRRIKKSGKWHYFRIPA